MRSKAAPKSKRYADIIKTRRDLRFGRHDNRVMLWAILPVFLGFIGTWVAVVFGGNDIGPAEAVAFVSLLVGFWQLIVTDWLLRRSYRCRCCQDPLKSHREIGNQELRHHCRNCDIEWRAFIGGFTVKAARRRK